MPYQALATLLPAATLALAALLPLKASAVADTLSSATANAGIGATGDARNAVDGPSAGPTSASTLVHWTTPATGNAFADAHMQASAGYGALHARGTTETTASFAMAVAGGGTAAEPTTAAMFDDHILISGGGPGPHVFRVYFALDGYAGHTGPAPFSFGARLSLQAWGSGITLTRAPVPTGISFFFPFIETYSVSASGNVARPFGERDYVEVSALDGSTLNLSGFLGAYLALGPTADGAAPSSAVLDIWNTGRFGIVPVSAGTVFTAASGHDYLAGAPVPEPAAAALMLLGLGGLLAATRRRPRG